MLMMTVLCNYKDADSSIHNPDTVLDENSVPATKASSSPHASDVDPGLPKQSLGMGVQGSPCDRLSISSIDNPSTLPIGLLLNNQIDVTDHGYLTRAPVLPPIGPVFSSNSNTPLDRRASFPFARAENTGDNQDFQRRPLAPYKHLLLSAHLGNASGQLQMQHPLLQPHIQTQHALYSRQPIPSLLALPSLFQAPHLSTENYSVVSNRYVQQQPFPLSFSIPQLLSRYTHCGYQTEAPGPEETKFHQDPPWSQEAQENRVARRFRRRYNQIERRYACSYPGCSKSYGLLNHLNTHIVTKKHGCRKAKADFQTSYFHPNHMATRYPASSTQTEFQVVNSPPFAQGNGAYAVVHDNRGGYPNACGISHGYKNGTQKFTGEEINAAKGNSAWNLGGGMQDPRGGMTFPHHQRQASPYQRHNSQQGLVHGGGGYHGEHSKLPPARSNFQTYSQINNYESYHIGPGASQTTSPRVTANTWEDQKQTLGGHAGSTQGYDNSRST